MVTAPSIGPFSLLGALYRDPEMADAFSAASTVQSWLDAESALAVAQANAGDLDTLYSTEIGRACSVSKIDLPALLESARLIWYPILPLIRQIAAQLPNGPDGRVHFGATTQEIMNSGLALRLKAAQGRSKRAPAAALNAEVMVGGGAHDPPDAPSASSPVTAPTSAILTQAERE